MEFIVFIFEMSDSYKFTQVMAMRKWCFGEGASASHEYLEKELGVFNLKAVRNNACGLHHICAL